MVRLIGAFHGHANVICLILCQLGEIDTDFIQVQSGHLFVQNLGQAIDFDLVLVVVSVLP